MPIFPKDHPLCTSFNLSIPSAFGASVSWMGSLTPVLILPMKYFSNPILA